MSTPITIAALRFTDDVPAMQRYLEALGLGTTITRGTDWAVLQSGAGQVWLHSAATSDKGAAAGTTEFSGEVADVEAFQRQLANAEVSASIVDEAYARTVEVTDPTGTLLLFNEVQSDTYGYADHAVTPDERLTVSLCRFTDPQGAYVGFAEALGLQREGEPNEWYVPYTAGTGIVGLHHDDGTNVGAPVVLGLTTTAPLEELQQRLSDAGFEPGRVVTEDFGSRIETVDPDGQALQIHAAPTSAG